MKLLVLFAVIGAALSTPLKVIEPSLFSSFENKHTANVMVAFIGGNKEVVNRIETSSFPSRTARLQSLKASLEINANSAQRDVQRFLESKSIPFKSFWINNKIFIRGATRELVMELAAFPKVAEITQEKIIPLDDPVKASGPAPLAEWGIERIQAEEAWETTNGTGVVVATIDTGVRYTHEALRSSWREDHGWLDPYNRSPMPVDNNGHGTHTMGTIVGTHGIGVAPGAKWISCLGCISSCSEAALIECGEWSVCPTNADGSDEDCSLAPVLVSNSWGGPGGDHWYEDVTEAWVAGHIIPLSSIGNSGTRCGTSGSPGDYRRVIGVGSTNIVNELSSYSSVGPSQDGRLKPEISAPGENVRSSIQTSDTAYGSKSGTSMACPHAAGVTALLLSMHPDMTFGQVRQALLNGTDHNVSSDGSQCNGIDDGTFPNHHFGWGIINALKVVENAKRSLNK